jgi:uncharacterized protein
MNRVRPVHLVSVTILLLLGIFMGQGAVASEPSSGVQVPLAPRSSELQKRIAEALGAKGENYKPRTEHFNKDGSPTYVNRLILEDSPYLIQHAHNPVDWHPWGDEAFARARRENKPIFLSIGYSTCHWCHVMERESFENPVIAGLLNRHFVSIKVDRERRPDVDETYMLAVMLTAGHGGWPMSSFLTPDGKPFYGGTYYRPDDFSRLVTRIAALWDSNRSDLLEQGGRVAAAVTQASQRRLQSAQIDHGVAMAAVKQIMSGHDELQGGFSQAPKFPQESLLFLLLQAVERNPDPEVLEALTVTLDAMARGGIHDQVGGGFHRYSIDNGWLVPHFEKMLYNQAHLARVYLQAWRLTGKPRFRRVAVQALDYVLRDMTSEQGGFYSATDADSEGGEGRFFLWTIAQIRQVLERPDAELAIELFGMSDKGNFEGSNILHLPVSVAEHAEYHGVPVADLYQRLDRIRAALYQAREKRPRMLRDEKIITAWNGAMISTLALAGDLLGEKRYLLAAQRAARFIWDNNWRRKSGQLWRVSLNGSSSVIAGQEDYAYYAEGLLHLYDASGDRVWLERAQQVADAMLLGFWDQGSGGFFMGRKEQQVAAMGRPRDSGGDGAMPSGNSVALKVLQMLSRRSSSLEYGNKARETLAAFSGLIKLRPSGFSYMLSAAMDLQQGEIAARGYVARGGVRAEARRLATDRLQVRIWVPDSWHINSDRPLQQGLIATRLGLLDNAGGWELSGISYPEAETQSLGFQSEPLSLYHGRVDIQAGFQPGSGAGGIIPLQLSLQACNDKVCLPPEKLPLRLPVWGAASR